MGGFIVGESPATSSLSLPAQPSSDYELAIDFRPDRKSTSASVGIILSFGQDQTMLVLSDAQHRCGFGTFGGKSLANGTGRRFVTCNLGKSSLGNRLVITVTSNGDDVEINTTLNGDPYFKYKGPANAPGLELRGTPPELGIAVMNGKVTFSKVEIRGARGARRQNRRRLERSSPNHEDSACSSAGISDVPNGTGARIGDGLQSTPDISLSTPCQLERRKRCCGRRRKALGGAELRAQVKGPQGFPASLLESGR